MLRVRLGAETFVVDRTPSSMGTRYRLATEISFAGASMVVEQIPDHIEASGYRRHSETCSRR